LSSIYDKRQVQMTQVLNMINHGVQVKILQQQAWKSKPEWGTTNHILSQQKQKKSTEQNAHAFPRAKPGKFGRVSENNNTCYKTWQYSLIEISDLELEGNDDSWAKFLKYVCIFSFFT